MLRPTLDELGIANETDKATVFTRTYAKAKGYTVHYETFFEPLRDHPIRFLEIGVGGGESIRMWLEYFSQIELYGLDNVQNTNEWNEPGVGVESASSYRFVHGDQGSAVSWACFLADHPGPFDIIVDDGSHHPKDIITSFEHLWPRVRESGYYCVEDLACGFFSPGYPTHKEWVGSLVDSVIPGNLKIDFVYVAQELVIIRKK